MITGYSTVSASINGVTVAFSAGTDAAGGEQVALTVGWSIELFELDSCGGDGWFAVLDLAVTVIAVGSTSAPGCPGHWYANAASVRSGEVL